MTTEFDQIRTVGLRLNLDGKEGISEPVVGIDQITTVGLRLRMAANTQTVNTMLTAEGIDQITNGGIATLAARIQWPSW